MQKFLYKQNMGKWILILTLFTTVSCKSKIKEIHDDVYSRHLQKHIQLSIISTPPPDDKNSFNLIIK